MSKFICIAKPEDILNTEQKVIGKTKERSLYYYKQLGKSVVYRRMTEDVDNDFVQLEYETEKLAKAACESINKKHSDNFVPQKIE